MSRLPALWTTPSQHLRSAMPERPVLYLAPEVLDTCHRRFRAGFPGLVTYAVKANDSLAVLENLAAGGMTAFDVASVPEMELVRGVLPSAVLHYNNPVRARAELVAAVALGVASFSVDASGELEKLADLGVPTGTEVAVRLKLPIAGASYDFGAKFGADPATCVELLQRVVALGFRPAMTFHPGTQCTDPRAWQAYIEACAEIAGLAGVRLGRLNVGGGFPAHRTGTAPDLEAIFAAVGRATDAAFGENAPGLLCEPGRAMVADAISIGCRVKTVRDDGSVFLDDGIYGGLAELPVLGLTDRIDVYSPVGRRRTGETRPRVVFGPTCDSLDRLPGTVPLPGGIREGDMVLFHGMGAYSTATTTRFNGYGHFDVTTVARLS